MQSLLGGADCSASSNPLNGMLKREAVDRSLLRDRNESPGAGPGPGSLRQLPFRPSPSSTPFTPQSRHSPSPAPAVIAPQIPQQPQINGWAAQYQPQGGITQQMGGGTSAVQMRQMEQAFQQSMSIRQQQQQQQGPTARMGQVTQHPPNAVQQSQWSNDFQQFQPHPQPPAQLSVPMAGVAQNQGYSGYEPQYQPQYQYQAPYQPQSMYSDFQPQYSGMAGHGYGYAPQQMQVPSQGHLQKDQIGLDEKAFADAFDQAEREALEAATESNLDKGKEKSTTAEPEPVPVPESTGPDFEAVWESIRPDAERLNKLAEWESEFSQFANGGNDELDLDLEQYMKDIGARDADFDGVERAGVGEGVGLRGVGFDGEGYPLLGDYKFEQDNPHQENMQAISQALHLLSTNGSLSEIASLLESSLASGSAPQQISELPSTSQVDKLDQHAQLQAKIQAGGEAAVWTLLGMVQAMDEKEMAAVRALEEGRRRFEAMGEARGKVADQMMGEGLVALAISYTNESYDHSALLSLHRYLTLLHPTYAGPVPSTDDGDLADEAGAIPNPWGANQRLTESFLSLARDQNRAGVVDADTQVGLGVLFYQTGEFDKARDCWVAALGVRPSDFLLWNRLGATLANHGNPEQAIDAYRRALELHPTYTRAIYNLGVACLNIGVYHEAAEHFLSGLALHETQDKHPNPNAPKLDTSSAHNSTALWATLRRAFNGMERMDLADKAAPGTDLSYFRQQGFDF